jgi:hypothetical protein
MLVMSSRRVRDWAMYHITGVSHAGEWSCYMTILQDQSVEATCSKASQNQQGWLSKLIDGNASSLSAVIDYSVTI